MNHTNDKFYYFKPNRHLPVKLVLTLFACVYVLQPPLNNLILDINQSENYHVFQWIVAYLFVVFSVTIFTLIMYMSISEKVIKIKVKEHSHNKNTKKLNFASVLFIFAIFVFFGLWSYVMLKLKIGVTIWAAFDPLPFRLTGLFVYGRLFIQPLVLIYIATTYQSSRFKIVIYVLLIALGGWVSLSSGSRFVGLIFSVPMWFLFTGKAKYIATAAPLFAFVIIATLARNFYLPEVIGDAELLQIYSNENYQTDVLDGLWLIPLRYLAERMMGISTLLLTLNFGATTPSFGDSLLTLISAFIPFVSLGQSVSIKNIYGLSDDAFGGYGLDVFANAWVLFGGNLFSYTIGLVLVALLTGKSYSWISIGIAKLGYRGLEGPVFFILVLLFFEGRFQLFPWIFFAAWFISRDLTTRLFHSLRRLFQPRRHATYRSLNAFHSGRMKGEGIGR